MLSQKVGFLVSRPLTTCQGLAKSRRLGPLLVQAPVNSTRSASQIKSTGPLTSTQHLAFLHTHTRWTPHPNLGCPVHSEENQLQTPSPPLGLNPLLSSALKHTEPQALPSNMPSLTDLCTLRSAPHACDSGRSLSDPGADRMYLDTITQPIKVYWLIF